MVELPGSHTTRVVLNRVPLIYLRVEAVFQFCMLESTPSVITDFTTHGESHFYGLPNPSVDSLDHMDHFFTFDVSKIIAKNTQKFPYATFKPFLTYIHGFDP